MAHVPFEQERLDNGLRVVLSHDDSAPTVAVNLWYDVGSKHERPGKTGFAHLFEHMMFQGSENVTKAEHMSLVQAAGGTLNASTWLDRTNYYETLPSHELDLALWLESDRMASLLPAMTQEKLDNQREVVKNERRQSVDNQPYGTWDEKLQELAYPAEHPYHHSTIGSMADLEAATLDDVREFFATYYCPNNAVLTIAGDFDRGAALASVERYFGPLPSNPALPEPPDTSLPPPGGEVRLSLADRVPLPRIYLGYRIAPFGQPGFDALEVAADLLASGRASRLYRSLVRERQLAQDVVAFALPFVGGALLALWATARRGIDADRLEGELLAEVHRLRDDGPSEPELQRVRNLQRARIESSLERVGERADRLSMYTCLFDDPGMVNTETERYARVDADRLRAEMVDALANENRIVLTYLPAEAPPEYVELEEPAVDVEGAA
ncbi:MAG: M16 family metallopeptidase [Candidatus Limnocylindria bacterium]